MTKSPLFMHFAVVLCASLLFSCAPDIEPPPFPPDEELGSSSDVGEQSSSSAFSSSSLASSSSAYVSSSSSSPFAPSSSAQSPSSSSSFDVSSSSVGVSSSSSSSVASSSSIASSSSSVVSSSSAVSSSSSKPSSSSGGSSSSSGGGSVGEYTGGSCNAADYGTVDIGGQIWMKKNWGCYAAGSKCYNNDPANCEKYGRLYDWSTAMDIDAKYNSQLYGGSDVKHKGVCPTGWHLPSDAEWTALTNFVGSNAGTKLKATTGWNSYSGVPAGTDEFGFSALPGGYGSSGGSFYGVGYGGRWWSASEYSSDLAYDRSMYYNGEDVYYSRSYKDYLFSVRCVQD